MENNKPRVVIVGGGFGGLYAAKRLAQHQFPLTILDRRNFHLFQPLLYQVATGFLSPGDIAAPIRSAVVGSKTTTVLQEEVIDIDVSKKVVVTQQSKLPYDFLIIATGVTHSYFGKEAWAKHAPGLKTVEDALHIRSKVLSAFEEAERTAKVEERKKQLTFIIVGGGPTGVELAGALAELAYRSMRGEFRNFSLQEVKIVLIEGGPRILPSFHQKTSAYTRKTLQKLGVEICTETKVINIDEGCVEVEFKGVRRTILGNNILWAAGVKASSLSDVITKQTGAQLDSIGRVKVDVDLSIPTSRDIFIIGDLAHAVDRNGRVLPGVAPVAIQQGDYVAQCIARRVAGISMKPFVYLDKGNMAVIGRGRAVAETWKIRLRGFVAWIAWALVHIYFLIEFENKLIVFIRWAWNYLTNRRGSRLIT